MLYLLQSGLQFESSFGDSSTSVFASLVLLFGMAQVIFWMVLGWRAMRAHERLADASERAVLAQRSD